jgi:ketosteroid isomerase-like protein
MPSSSKYPSREDIASIFRHLETGDSAETFKRVSPDVDWTVMGTHPCGGHYKSLKEFQEATFQRLGKIMKPPGIKLKVRNVIGGEDQEWAVVELVAVAECNSGKSGGLRAFTCQGRKTGLLQR